MRPLRILFLEDNPTDVLLSERILHKAGQQFESLRVESELAFIESLDSYKPDLVLADFNLPNYDGLQALAYVNQFQPELPFIFVTGAMGEERAVQSLHQGAADYILKDRPGRLAEAVIRAFEKKQQQDELKKEHRLRLRQEKIFRAALNSVRDAFIVSDDTGDILEWNPAAEALFGYTRSEVLGRDLHALLAPQRYHEPARKGMQRFRENGEGSIIGQTLELMALRRDGSEFEIEISFSRIEVDNSHLAVGQIRDITEKKDYLKKIEHLALYDVLTDLPNRHLLINRLHHEMAQVPRSGQGLALLFIDLDGFKHVNDEYGHETGDALLRELAGRMKRTMREGDTISRFGGDEFVAILVDVADQHGCQSLIKRLLQACAMSVMIEQQELRVSASIGVAFYSALQTLSVENLLHQADSAMYRAKQSGKNNFHIYE